VTDATDQTPMHPNTPREGEHAARPEGATSRKHRWELRLPAWTQGASVLATEWLQLPPDLCPRLGIVARRRRPAGHLALYLEGSADVDRPVTATVLGRIDPDRGDAPEFFPAYPYIRFRAELDPWTPVGEVTICVEPEQQA
jgi:hypothetical protein